MSSSSGRPMGSTWSGYIRDWRARTSATNGFVISKSPNSRTAASPWYQAPSASRVSPSKRPSRWRQVENADLDVAVERVRDGMPEDHLLDPVAGLRHDLHDA